MIANTWPHVVTVMYLKTRVMTEIFMMQSRRDRLSLTTCRSIMNSRKSVRWSAVSVAPKLVYVEYGGKTGSGPKESITYAELRSQHWGLDISHEAGIGAPRLGLELQGWDWSLKSGIGASNQELKP